MLFELLQFLISFVIGDVTAAEFAHGVDRTTRIGAEGRWIGTAAFDAPRRLHCDWGVGQAAARLDSGRRRCRERSNGVINRQLLICGMMLPHLAIVS